MVFKSIMELIKGRDGKTLNSNPVTIDDYVEVPIKIHDDGNIIKIKVCELDDYRDATDISVMVEAGYIVIANTINLDRDIDEDYAKLLAYLKDKISECNGTIIKVCESKIMAVPHNVVIEKLVKEPEETSAAGIKNEEE
ncbi:cell division protein SepF [Methanothermococcus sp.]|uniref:cell division protein SepF n=1 Tax=Methanothermococcus sp. TaxID=2614238 RepID=UPI0025F13615|nr:cell division protein SepF [Methanothermococcus sp.]